MIKSFNNFTWWLDLTQSTEIPDSCFTIAKNVFYNNAKKIETRRWYAEFAPALDDTINSTFFFQRDDTGATMLLVCAGTKMYKYDETGNSWTTIKTWLTEYETLKPTQRVRWDFCVYKNVVYMCNGVDKYASYDWTTYTEHAAEPKVRYLNYLQDRIFWAWEDSNPSTVYYTNAAPSSWNTINTHAVVVWWDEAGGINGMTEYNKLIIVGKNYKTYSLDVTNKTSQQIPTQSGMYSDRCIANVNDDLLFFNERWIDALKAKQYEWWIETKPLSEKVREIVEDINPNDYNAQCGYYIKPINNYYFSLDTDNDNIPDTHLIYNTALNARTQYNYPWIYDYCDYITATPETFRLFASGKQLYRMEYGYTDNDADILAELETKEFDFWDPAQLKTSNFVDITGWKQIGKPLIIKIKANGNIEATGEVTNRNLDYTAYITIESLTLSEDVLSEETLWFTNSGQSSTQLYKFNVKIPLFIRFSTISVNISSVWVQRQLEKLRIDVNWQPKEMFYYNDII